MNIICNLFTANMNMNIIPKEHSRIYPNIQFFATLWCRIPIYVARESALKSLNAPRLAPAPVFFQLKFRLQLKFGKTFFLIHPFVTFGSRDLRWVLMKAY